MWAAGDHLGLNYITTVQDLAVLKRVIVQNVAATGVAVLNAADPNVAIMASKCRGSVTFFALDKHHPVMATHRAQGQAVVYVENGHIVAAKGIGAKRIALADIPLTLGGAIGFQVENAMASVAAAWALGVDWDTIRHGLAGFSNDADNAARAFQPVSLPRCHRDCRLWPQPRRHGGPGAGGAGHARHAPHRWSSVARVTGATRTFASRPKFWATRLTR
jgi:hypothetical protein